MIETTGSPLSLTPVSQQVGDTPPTSQEGAALHAAAEAFEAVFLAEMLAHSGVGKPPATFGGGVGEDAFASFLTRSWAETLAADGGIGLADDIRQAMAARGYGDV